MKKYFGNYLGIVISRKDTESRGRLKVYIPHIMPVLNANLLKLFGIQGEETISFNAVGGNINGGIPEPARAYLENILPYAEPASPIIGSSSPGVKNSSGNVSQNAIGAGNMDKSALVPGNSGVLSTPSTPKIIPPPSTNQQELFQNSAKYGKVSPQAMAGNQGAGLCATGVRQIAGGMTGDNYFSNGLSSGSGGSANASSLSNGNDYFQKSGYYQPPQSLPSDYIPQKGDIVSGTKGSSPGHVQIYDGQNWVSDFTQSGMSTSYDDLTLHRMTPEASANVGGKPNTDVPPKPVENNIIPTTENTYNQFYKVKGTTFGYQDSGDNGLGAWGRNTNNTTLIGVSLNASASGKNTPEDGITSVLFGSANTAKNKLVEVYNPATGKSFIGPIVDKGPLNTLSNGIDLTAGGSIALGGTAKGSYEQGVYYRVLTSAEQTQYSNLVGDGAIGGQAMSAPVGNVSIFSDALFGVTNQQATENLKSLVSGTPPPYPPSPTTSQTPAGKQTMTTTNISPAPYDTTNVAKGVFSVPQVGALLWCFFREGNPLFPVYFAASYRSGEWASAYKSSSPGVNNDTSLEGDQTKSSTTIMPTKGGGVISTEGSGSHEVSMVAYSGAHLKFHENHTILYSPDDFHSQADGNKFDITLSNRETHTKGICNTVVNGDCFEKIGNVTDQSVHDAINGIESLISKINDEMLKHS